MTIIKWNDLKANEKCPYGSIECWKVWVSLPRITTKYMFVKYHSRERGKH